ncbi:hypothetical protein BDN72DRAFT_858855 [Pluteus cervinus]|uniref:Uncharacterized protein n=1 Tax=Pluteus cervinus TaxID=181527 RepID=A0ACD3AQ06_9AGAR|nr:hypothetical protein BDN72DRAFT_858855 [Pluteus cervinus]
MSRFTRLFYLISLAAVVSASTSNSTAPSSSPNLNTSSPTDSDTIANTIQQVNQKAGPTDNAPPSSDVPPTVVTAVDGDVTAAGQSGDSLLQVLHDPDSHPDLDTGSTVSKREVALKKRGGYEQVFDGTGADPSDRDASIQGTAYLTFTRLDTYDLSACEAFCDGIEACVFVNLFSEFNSDATYNPQFKCAAYGDVHTAAEKTNFGGQQLLPSPAGVTYIQQSVGYAADTLVDPDVPNGYQLVFGPTDGANNAPGGLVRTFATLVVPIPVGEFASTSTYGVLSSMYYIPTDASTATNTGQGDLSVTYSRGYQRISILPDGGFEDYLECDDFCYASSDANWVGTIPSGGSEDAEIFYDTDYARTGHGSLCLGSSSGADALPGTMTTANPLDTVAGSDYWIQFFQESAFRSNPEDAAFVNVFWNGVQVLAITPGYQTWTPYQVSVTAVGSDVLSFTGGSFPSYDFLDDISLFLA